MKSGHTETALTTTKILKSTLFNLEAGHKRKTFINLFFKNIKNYKKNLFFTKEGI